MRVIGVVSGKGGVGKTTLVSNLGVSLAHEGLDVAIIDSNLTGANLGLHFGLTYYTDSLHHVIKDEIPMSSATYSHPSGINIVPASLSIKHIDTEPKDISRHIKNAMPQVDYVLIDAATGLDRETIAAIKSSDELIIVTHPELPTLSDALRTKNLAERYNKKLTGIVLNRIKRGDEIKSDHVASFLNMPIIGLIKEDGKVRKSIERKNPVTLEYPRSIVSKQFKRVAYNLLDRNVDVKPNLSEKVMQYLGA